MKTNTWISMALAAALNLGGFFTITSMGAETAAPTHGGYLHRIAERLNLTKDQKAQIKSVLQAERDTLTSLRTQLRTTRENLRDAIRAADANETSVRAASARVAAAEADLAVERMKLFAKIAPILTDEQRQQLSDLDQRADAFVHGTIAHAGERVAE